MNTPIFLGVFLWFYSCLGVLGGTHSGAWILKVHTLLVMVRKNRRETTKYHFPDQFTRIEHEFFVASCLVTYGDTKTGKPVSIYGIDLLAKKICPDQDMFFSFMTEIFQEEFSASSMFGAEFIVSKAIAKSLLSDSKHNRPIDQNDSILNFWISIASYETIEFIDQLLNKINSNPVCREKAWAVVTRLLQNYSTGQLWNLSYKANQKVCELALRNELGSADRSDVLLDIMLEKGLLYIKNDWSLSPFKRWGKQCKQSEISKYFFDKILGIGEAGFSKRPSLELVLNKNN